MDATAAGTLKNTLITAFRLSSMNVVATRLEISLTTGRVHLAYVI